MVFFFHSASQRLGLNALLGGLVGLISVLSSSGMAAEQLVVTYGPYQASFTLGELEALATTGEVSSSLEFYLDLANVEPEDLRAILSNEMRMNHGFLDSMLNSQGGEYMLSEMTQVIHTPSQQADIQALRSAIVLSASDDRRISLLELLQKYPTPQVYINGANLLQLARDLDTDQIADHTEDSEDEANLDARDSNANPDEDEVDRDRWHWDHHGPGSL